MTQAEAEREPGEGSDRRKPLRMFKKDTRLPVVKQNIETGYSITENNKGHGCDIAVEAGGQDEPGDVRNCGKRSLSHARAEKDEPEGSIFQVSEKVGGGEDKHCFQVRHPFYNK